MSSAIIEYPKGQHAPPGGKVPIKATYTGAGPAPQDIHLYVKNVGDSGYPQTPAGSWDLDPDRVPPKEAIFNWPVGSDRGSYDFLVEWTWKGTTPPERGAEGQYFVDDKEVADEPKVWSWAMFWWRVLGAVLSGAAGSAFLNWWTGAAILACILTGALGGAAGSALGQLFTWLFDAPKIKWTERSGFLFAVFFTLAFTVAYGLWAIGLEREADLRGELFNRVTFGVAAISGFLASTLAGVLNNLRD